MGWAIAAGVMAAAPEAMAGGLAPQGGGAAGEVAPNPAAVSSGGEIAPQAGGDEARGNGRLSRYLQRPVRYGAHFLDHGVLQPAIAGGWPHMYRVELSLGLLDHIT